MYVLFPILQFWLDVKRETNIVWEILLDNKCILLKKVR